MRVIFVGADGHAYAEKVKLPRYRMIEEPDGFHPVNRKSVWTHEGRTGEPFVLIWQGSSSPEGDISTKPLVTSQLVEGTILMMARQKMPVSRYWARKLNYWLLFAGRTLYFIGITTCLVFLLFVIWLVAG